MRTAKRELEKFENNNSKKENYYELISLYNNLDDQQRSKFHQRLAKVIKKPVLPQRVENYLNNLTSDNYDELSVYAKLLLVI